MEVIATLQEQVFRFGADIVKAEQNEDGDWVFEGIASMPGRDLQGEEIEQKGLEIDYLLGKGLPPGAGGFINYDHDASTIVGVPLDGKIDNKGFWLKWKALKTPFMTKVVDQMKAMKDAGWPRRYGMSIEGVVRETDPKDPTRILRAFIRNVALTPTPVHPGTYVDFAKSLSAHSVVQFQPEVDIRRFAVAAWAETAAGIHAKTLPIAKSNPYFTPHGTFRLDADVDYFRDVHGLPESAALWCARFALSRERAVIKAVDETLANRFNDRLVPHSPRDPHEIIHEHLTTWKQLHPECPHITDDGRIRGDRNVAARHFHQCEHRGSNEVAAVMNLMHEKDGDFFGERGQDRGEA